MDPYEAYRQMHQAMETSDHETANEHAHNLCDWFRKGGFCPYQVTPIAMRAYIASVLRRTSTEPYNFSELIGNFALEHCGS